MTEKTLKDFANLINAIVNVPVKTERCKFITGLGAKPLGNCLALRNESAIAILNAIHGAGYRITRQSKRKG